MNNKEVSLKTGWIRPLITLCLALFPICAHATSFVFRIETQDHQVISIDDSQAQQMGVLRSIIQFEENQIEKEKEEDGDVSIARLSLPLESQALENAIASLEPHQVLKLSSAKEFEDLIAAQNFLSVSESVLQKSLDAYADYLMSADEVIETTTLPREMSAPIIKRILKKYKELNPAINFSIHPLSLILHTPASGSVGFFGPKPDQLAILDELKRRAFVYDLSSGELLEKKDFSESKVAEFAKFKNLLIPPAAGWKQARVISEGNSIRISQANSGASSAQSYRYEVQNYSFQTVGFSPDGQYIYAFSWRCGSICPLFPKDESFITVWRVLGSYESLQKKLLAFIDLPSTQWFYLAASPEMRQHFKNNLRNINKHYKHNKMKKEIYYQLIQYLKIDK
jgi:hypothetical protein